MSGKPIITRSPAGGLKPVPDESAEKDKDGNTTHLKVACPPDIVAPAADLHPDARCRLLILANAVHAAYDQVTLRGGAHDNAATLKVFLAPEFCFSCKGGFNFPTLQTILIELEKMFSNRKFANWLIFPGTIVTQIDLGVAPPQNRPIDTTEGIDHAKDRWFLNTAVCVNGGVEKQLTVANPFIMPTGSTIQLKASRIAYVHKTKFHGDDLGKNPEGLQVRSF